MSASRLSPDKDVRAIATQCQRMGWEVQRQGTGHLLIVAPNGERVSMSSTPSSRSSVRCYRAKVNKIVRQMKESNR